MEIKRYPYISSHEFQIPNLYVVRLHAIKIYIRSMQLFDFIIAFLTSQQRILHVLRKCNCAYFSDSLLIKIFEHQFDNHDWSERTVYLIYLLSKSVILLDARLNTFLTVF
jgi:hypothetical protein